MPTWPTRPDPPHDIPADPPPEPIPEVESLWFEELVDGNYVGGTAIQEGDQTRVRGRVIDVETGDPAIGISVTVRVDLDFNGQYFGHEIFGAISGADGLFSVELPTIADDGPSFDSNGQPGGNGTPSDPMSAEALPSISVNQDPEKGKKTTSETIKNVVPVLNNDSIHLTFQWNGALAVSATVTGSFTDPSITDVHDVSIKFGDSIPTPAVTITGHDFDVTHAFSAPGTSTRSGTRTK